ncbi:hypothetical protein Tco_1306269, partial [Tanacetum coccineum]
ETDTESEPFEDLETETPESPHIVAPPACHDEESEGSGTSGARSTSSNSTAPLSPDHPLTHATPILVPSLQVEAMSDSAFRKRFRSSYDSSPSPTLLVWKRYRGMSEYILDTDSEEDEEVEESSDSNSESEDAKDEGPTAGDEGPAVEDEGLAAGDEDPTPVVETSVGEPLGLGYGALRRRELALREGQMPSVFEVGQGSGSVPEPEGSERVSTCRQPVKTIKIVIDLEDGRTYIDIPAYPPPAPPVQTPPSLEWSSCSFPISPAHSVTATIPVDEDQFLEAGHVDTRMAEMSQAGYDDHWLVHDLLVQQTALQRELQEMRGHVTALEQEKDRREQ